MNDWGPVQFEVWQSFMANGRRIGGKTYLPPGRSPTAKSGVMGADGKPAMEAGGMAAPAQTKQLFGDGTHEGGLTRDPDSVSKYAQAVGISAGEATDRVWAVSGWTRSAYKDIRADQKAGRPNADADLIEAHIRDSAPFAGTIVRGGGLRQGETIADLKKKLENGTSSLASWSSDEKVAKDFASQRSLGGLRDSFVLRVANNTRGVSIQNLSRFPYEKEVIVPSKTRYRVVRESFETGAGGGRISILDLEEI